MNVNTSPSTSKSLFVTSPGIGVSTKVTYASLFATGASLESVGSPITVI